ncbi:MAG: S1 RNA-binding domain-containing protein [Anaerolineae bacterium]|nr:S1 RNA-binding domain-containing protein [Anaerolineae bacterium]MCX8067214.1 S1 RNA-binding domain-containing protein [Anaerolineae bacterium]MDW7990816.1 S1 RNA-binding domain-containing protein [Anaerolineae bacterium]
MDTESQIPSRPQPAAEEMARLLEEFLPCAHLQRGDIVRGRVVAVSPNGIIVDVGFKCEGVVPEAEVGRLDPALRARLKPGATLSVYVVDPEGPDGRPILSIIRAQAEQGWEYARSLMENGKVVELTVASANRGGLIVYLGGLRGFIPASHLSPSRNIPRISDPACLKALSQLVGTSLRVRVIEADQERNRLILSERAAESRPEPSLLESLREGDIRQGRVSNITDFGAFVDLGGINGLVHISELSWGRVDHPGQVLQIGQEVEVLVLAVDRERGRVSLSLKRLHPDPWAAIAERYRVGQLVECRITRLTQWGAFACIVGNEEIEGLIHASELTDSLDDETRALIRPDRILTLRIIRLEPERHRLGLSLRQVTQWEEPFPLEGKEAVEV